MHNMVLNFSKIYSLLLSGNNEKISMDNIPVLKSVISSASLGNVAYNIQANITKNIFKFILLILFFIKIIKERNAIIKKSALYTYVLSHII